MLGEKSWKVVSEKEYLHSTASYISPSVLELMKMRSLDNRYKCSSCDRHVDAVKR